MSEEKTLGELGDKARERILKKAENIAEMAFQAAIQEGIKHEADLKEFKDIIRRDIYSPGLTPSEFFHEVYEAMKRKGIPFYIIDMVSGVDVGYSDVEAKISEANYSLESIEQALQQLKEPVKGKLSEEEYNRLLEQVDFIRQAAEALAEDAKKVVELEEKAERLEKLMVRNRLLEGMVRKVKTELASQRKRREEILEQLEKAKKEIKQLKESITFIVIKPFKEALVPYKLGDTITIAKTDLKSMEWAKTKMAEGYIKPISEATPEELAPHLKPRPPEVREALTSLEALLKG